MNSKYKHITYNKPKSLFDTINLINLACLTLLRGSRKMRLKWKSGRSNHSNRSIVKSNRKEKLDENA